MQNMAMVEIRQIPVTFLKQGSVQCAMINLPTLLGDHLPDLPVVLRLLAENAARNMADQERRRALQATTDWRDTGSSDREIAPPNPDGY